MPSRVSDRQADEAAAGVGVGVRRPLAGEIGQEEQAPRCRPAPLGPRRPADRRFRVSPACRGRVGLAQFVAEPLQRAAGAEIHAHDVPAAVDGVAEGMHAAQRIDFHFVAVDEHHAGGADRGARARPWRRCRCRPPPPHNRRPRRPRRNRSTGPAASPPRA